MRNWFEANKAWIVRTVGTRFGIFVLIALGVLVSASAGHASATNVYVSQNGGTFSGGSACNGQTTISLATLNSSSSWGGGASQIGPGTTVYLCGTLTGAANSTVVGIQSGGTSGSPVTLLWDTGAIVTAPVCPGISSGGCVDIEGNAFVTLNGGTNGIIQNTANGTGLTYHQSSTAIQAIGAANLTVENLTIQNIYVHTSASDSTIDDSSAVCIYDNGSANNWVIQNNTMHDMSWCISIQYNTTSNVTIAGNNIYNIDHGIAFGGPSSGYTLSNVNIYKNKIHDYSNWDTSGDDYHHDGVHIWGNGDNGSDTITNVNIYDNMFGGCIGQNVTAHVFMEANGGNTTNVSIYNNTFIDTCSGADNDGMLTTGVDGGYKIYNNTFMGTAGDTCMGTSSSPNVTFVNNVVSGCGILMYIASGGSFASGGLHNNVYANCAGSNCFAYKGNYSGSFSTWQSEAGGDASPSTYVSGAGLNSSGLLQTGSAAINAGANLTSLNLMPLDSDIVGTLRPSSGAWAAGAYSSGTSASQPAPPTGLTAIAQ
jgi:hypothetical protein